MSQIPLAGRLAAVLAAAFCLPGAVVAQPTFLGAPLRGVPEAPAFPPGFYLEDAAVGAPFNTPVAVAFVPDGRMFVAEKRGLVWVVADGVRLSEPFLDLQAEVLDHHDRGLLGIAVDGQGRVLVLYTVDRDGSGDYERTDAFGRLTRYSPLAGDPNRADPASRRVLVGPTMATGFPNCFFSHSVGTVVVAPDGTLLVGSGDGAHYGLMDDGGEYPDCFGPGRFDPSEDIGAFRALRLESLGGKILRIDPETGQGLPSNPYWNGDPDAAASKVWAFGFRNPYRFGLRPGGSTDPSAGNPGLVMAGDVGWGKWEELNGVQGGENYAWPCREGQEVQPRYHNASPPTNGCDSLPPYGEPSAYWHHWRADRSSPPGREADAIIGGAFYAGDRYPADYAGAYFYGDFVNGWTAVARFDPDGALLSDTLFSPDMGFVVDYEYDPTTAFIHLVDIAFGKVYRLRHAGDENSPPVATAAATPTQGSAPLTVQFSSAGTFDPDGDALTYAWAFGDGGASTDSNPSHTYTALGAYTAVLTVSDGLATGTAQVTITVGGAAPSVIVLSPAEGTAALPGERVLLSAAVADPDQPSGTPLQVTWDVEQVHDTHTHLDVFTAATTSASFPVPFHGDAGEVVFYRLRVTVTDDDGLTATAERALRVQVAGEADVTPTGTAVASGSGTHLGRIRDGVLGPEGSTLSMFEFRTGTGTGGIAHAGYTFAAAKPFTRALFQEGTAAGGGFEGLRVEVRQGGVWQPVSGLHVLPAYDPDDGSGYGLFTLLFLETTGDGLRIAGAPTGSTAAVGELRVFARDEETLPDPWLTRDVGAPVAGFAAYREGFFEAGGGGDVDGSADAFRYVYRPLVGDGTLTTRVRAVEGTRPDAKGGLMIRADLTPSSPQASVFVTPSGSVVFRQRGASGAVIEEETGADPEQTATWLRLQRAGDLLSAFSSSDGQTWFPAGSATVPMGQTVWTGLAVASADDGTHGDLATATFENTSLVAQALPSPWAATDVGMPPAAGRTHYADGTFTVEGGGDAWNEVDDFYLAYQALPGDGAITARVTALEGLHPWAKAGVLLRAGLDPAAPNVFLVVTEGRGIYFQYRLAAGGTSQTVAVSRDSGTPVWLRLRRTGNRVTGDASADGQHWRAVGTVTLPLGTGAVAGLGVSSADYGERQDLARAVFQNVTVVGGGLQAVEGPVAQAQGQAAPFGVEAIFPEPSDGRFTVRLGLDRPGRVRVEAFDMLGRRVFLRDMPEQAAGVLQVPVDLGTVSAGLYVLRVRHLDTGASAARRLTVTR